MDIVSTSTRRILISLRLGFCAVLILTFAGATAIKKPTHRHTADSSELSAETIAYLADFSSLGMRSSASAETVADTDNLDVPITSAPDDESDARDGESNSDSNDGSDGDNAAEQSAESAAGNSSELSNSAYQRSTYSGRTTSSNPATTSSANNSGSSSAQNSTTIDYGSAYYDADSPYSGQVFVDDNGVPIENPSTYPIPNHNSDNTDNGDTDSGADNKEDNASDPTGE